MPTPAARPVSRYPLRVLVVDDIAASRNALAVLVRHAGHEVIEAASGAQALAIVWSQPVDLVLLDLLMPDMDGFEATRRLRETHERGWLPIVVMSSMRGAEHFVRAIEEGADDFLPKPVDPQLLEAKIRNLARVLDLQASLGELAAHNRELFDHVEDAVLTVEDGDRIRDANAAGFALLGLDALPPDGAPLRELLPDELIDALRGDSPPATCELIARRPNGERFPAEVSISRWRGNAHRRVSLVIRDVTERQRLDRLKDEFLSTVSHELRTPLTSVTGAIDLLAAGVAGPLPEPAKKLLDVARRNGERLGRLIDDVLDVAKLEADRMALRPRPAPLDALLDEATAAIGDYARRFGATVRRVGPPAGVDVRVDTDRFLQVMANLLSNALKNSPAGEPVEIRCAAGHESVRIAVRDRGKGIPDAFRARIFEKFSQADERDRRVGTGTGLGLYITRILIERMDGTIGVVSAPGRGAEFQLDLPLAGAQGRHTPPRSAPLALVVDRDDAARAAAEAALAPCFAVRAARTPDALATPNGIAPALVVADPHGDAAALDALAPALAALAGPAPVLLHTDALDADAAQRAGFGHLPKRGTDADTLMRAACRLAHPERGDAR